MVASHSTASLFNVTKAARSLQTCWQCQRLLLPCSPVRPWLWLSRAALLDNGEQRAQQGLSAQSQMPSHLRCLLPAGTGASRCLSTATLLACVSAAVAGPQGTQRCASQSRRPRKHATPTSNTPMPSNTMPAGRSARASWMRRLPVLTDVTAHAKMLCGARRRNSIRELLADRSSLSWCRTAGSHLPPCLFMDCTESRHI